MFNLSNVSARTRLNVVGISVKWDVDVFLSCKTSIIDILHTSISLQVEKDEPKFNFLGLDKINITNVQIF